MNEETIAVIALRRIANLDGRECTAEDLAEIAYSALREIEAQGKAHLTDTNGFSLAHAEIEAEERI